MKNAENVMTFIFVLFCMLMISACGEKTSSTITLNPDFGNEADVSGAKLTMTNNSGKKSHIYKQTANGADVLFNKIVPGIYTLTVEHNDYFAFSVDNITVNNTVSGFTANLTRKGPAGGYVFYDKGNSDSGWRFLEVAPASAEFNAQWGADGTNVSGTQTDIGTGNANTQIINTKLQELGETGCASQLCIALNIGGKNDWFLPSMDELNLMYQNLHKNGLGDFGKGSNSESWMNLYYWSSSQGDGYKYSAWFQSFGSGLQNDYNKDSTPRVRAVRAF